jgi:hypothetical protein
VVKCIDPTGNGTSCCTKSLLRREGDNVIPESSDMGTIRAQEGVHKASQNRSEAKTIQSWFFSELFEFLNFFLQYLPMILLIVVLGMQVCFKSYQSFCTPNRVTDGMPFAHGKGSFSSAALEDGFVGADIMSTAAIVASTFGIEPAQV